MQMQAVCRKAGRRCLQWGRSSSRLTTLRQGWRRGGYGVSVPRQLNRRLLTAVTLGGLGGLVAAEAEVSERDIVAFGAVVRDCG